MVLRYGFLLFLSYHMVKSGVMKDKGTKNPGDVEIILTAERDSSPIDIQVKDQKVNIVVHDKQHNENMNTVMDKDSWAKAGPDNSATMGLKTGTHVKADASKGVTSRRTSFTDELTMTEGSHRDSVLSGSDRKRTVADGRMKMTRRQSEAGSITSRTGTVRSVGTGDPRSGFTSERFGKGSHSTEFDGIRRTKGETHTEDRRSLRGGGVRVDEGGKTVTGVGRTVRGLDGTLKTDGKINIKGGQGDTATFVGTGIRDTDGNVFTKTSMKSKTTDGDTLSGGSLKVEGDRGVLKAAGRTAVGSDGTSTSKSKITMTRNNGGTATFRGTRTGRSGQTFSETIRSRETSSAVSTSGPKDIRQSLRELAETKFAGKTTKTGSPDGPITEKGDQVNSKVGTTVTGFVVKEDSVSTSGLGVNGVGTSSVGKITFTGGEGGKAIITTRKSATTGTSGEKGSTGGRFASEGVGSKIAAVGVEREGGGRGSVTGTVVTKTESGDTNHHGIKPVRRIGGEFTSRRTEEKFSETIRTRKTIGVSAQDTGTGIGDSTGQIVGKGSIKMKTTSGDTATGSAFIVKEERDVAKGSGFETVRADGTKTAGGKIAITGTGGGRTTITGKRTDTGDTRKTSTTSGRLVVDRDGSKVTGVGVNTVGDLGKGKGVFVKKAGSEFMTDVEGGMKQSVGLDGGVQSTRSEDSFSKTISTRETSNVHDKDSGTRFKDTTGLNVGKVKTTGGDTAAGGAFISKDDRGVSKGSGFETVRGDGTKISRIDETEPFVGRGRFEMKTTGGGTAAGGAFIAKDDRGVAKGSGFETVRGDGTKTSVGQITITGTGGDRATIIGKRTETAGDTGKASTTSGRLVVGDTGKFTDVGVDMEGERRRKEDKFTKTTRTRESSRETRTRIGETAPIVGRGRFEMKTTGGGTAAGGAFIAKDERGEVTGSRIKNVRGDGTKTSGGQITITGTGGGRATITGKRTETAGDTGKASTTSGRLVVDDAGKFTGAGMEGERRRKEDKFTKTTRTHETSRETLTRIGETAPFVGRGRFEMKTTGGGTAAGGAFIAKDDRGVAKGSGFETVRGDGTKTSVGQITITGTGGDRATITGKRTETAGDTGKASTTSGRLVVGDTGKFTDVGVDMEGERRRKEDKFTKTTRTRETSRETRTRIGETAPFVGRGRFEMKTTGGGTAAGGAFIAKDERGEVTGSRIKTVSDDGTIRSRGKMTVSGQDSGRATITGKRTQTIGETGKTSTTTTGRFAGVDRSSGKITAVGVEKEGGGFKSTASVVRKTGPDGRTDIRAGMKVTGRPSEEIHSLRTFKKVSETSSTRGSSTEFVTGSDSTTGVGGEGAFDGKITVTGSKTEPTFGGIATAGRAPKTDTFKTGDTQFMKTTMHGSGDQGDFTVVGNEAGISFGGVKTGGRFDTFEKTRTKTDRGKLTGDFGGATGRGFTTGGMSGQTEVSGIVTGTRTTDRGGRVTGFAGGSHEFRGNLLGGIERALHRELIYPIREANPLLYCRDCAREICVVPHKEECFSFVECIRTAKRRKIHAAEYVAIVYQCPHGTMWDYKAYACVHPDRKDTCLSEPCQDHNMIAYEHPDKNCKTYWECVDGVSRARCCGGGMAFNAKLHRCENSTTCYAMCPRLDQSVDKCKMDLTTVSHDLDDKNCRTYWKCEDGSSIGACCPRGNRYDDDAGGCVVDKRCQKKCPPGFGGAGEPCSSDRNVKGYRHGSYCRSFMKCITDPSGRRRPYPVCCPNGYYFHDELQSCLWPTYATDAPCNVYESCLNGFRDCGLERGYSDDRHYIPMGTEQEMPCANGTRFDENTCLCSRREPNEYYDCYINFIFHFANPNKLTNDAERNWNEVKSDTRKGKDLDYIRLGDFDGYSAIQLPTMDHNPMNKLYLELSFENNGPRNFHGKPNIVNREPRPMHPEHSGGPERHILFSNCRTDRFPNTLSPSIDVSLEPESGKGPGMGMVVIKASNDTHTYNPDSVSPEYNYVTLKLDYKIKTKYHLLVTYDGEEIGAKLRELGNAWRTDVDTIKPVEVYAPLSGELYRSEHPAMLGACPKGRREKLVDGFNGQLNLFKFAKCVPMRFRKSGDDYTTIDSQV